MRMLVSTFAISVVSSFSLLAQTSQQDSPEALRKYVPVLPSVKAQYWQIDPQLGYAVRNVGGGVYVVSDNRWQSAFLVTDEGVIVFDAPASFGKSLIVGDRKSHRQASQDARLLAHPQGPPRRVGGVQGHEAT